MKEIIVFEDGDTIDSVALGLIIRMEYANGILNVWFDKSQSSADGKSYNMTKDDAVEYMDLWIDYKSRAK